MKTRGQRADDDGVEVAVHRVEADDDHRPGLGNLAATGDSYGKVLLWDLEAKRQAFEFERCEEQQVCCVAFSADGTLLASGGADKTLRIWEVASGRERRRFLAPLGSVVEIALAPDGRTVAAGCVSA